MSVPISKKIRGEIFWWAEVESGQKREIRAKAPELPVIRLVRNQKRFFRSKKVRIFSRTFFRTILNKYCEEACFSGQKSEVLHLMLV